MYLKNLFPEVFGGGADQGAHHGSWCTSLVVVCHVESPLGLGMAALMRYGVFGHPLRNPPRPVVHSTDHVGCRGGGLDPSEGCLMVP